MSTGTPSLGRATLLGVLWSNLGIVATKLLSFLAILVLARLLAPDEFGVVAAVTVFLGFIELASDLGMKSAVIYEQEEGLSDRVRTAFSINLVLAAMLTVTGVLLAPLVAAFFGLEEQTHLFRLAALNLMLTGLGNVHDALLMRELDFRARLRPELIRGVVRAAVSIALALSGLGAAALVWGMLAGTLAWTLVLWTLRPLRPRLRVRRAVVRQLLDYGTPSAALVVLSTIGARADSLAVGRLLGERALGLYTIAFRIPELAISTVAWQLSWVLFPALSRQRALDAEGLGPVTLRLVRLQALYVGPLAAGLAVLGTPLVVVVFGEQWRPAGAVLSAVAVLAAAEALLVPLGDALKASARQRWLIVLNLVHVPAFVVLLVLLADQGILAVAWARVASQVVFAAALAVTAARLLALPLGRVVAALGPGAVAALGVLAGAGAVQLSWTGGEATTLVLGAAAGVVGGVGALRLLAGGTLTELTGAVRTLRPQPS